MTDERPRRQADTQAPETDPEGTADPDPNRGQGADPNPETDPNRAQGANPHSNPETDPDPDPSGGTDADPNPDAGDGTSPAVRADGGSFGEPPETGIGRGFPGVPLRPGLLLGMTAFLGTYAVVYNLRAGRLASALGGLPFALSTPTPDIAQVVGWLFYRAHLVPIKYSVSGAESDSGLLSFGDFPGATRDFVQALEPGLLLAVPLFMLFVAGFYTAIECDATTPRTGAVSGATVVLGYLVFVVAAVLVLTWSVSLSLFDLSVTASVGPEEVQAVFVAGVLYPLAGGALGGAAAGKVAE